MTESEPTAKTKPIRKKRRRWLVRGIIGLVVLIPVLWLGANLWLDTDSFSRLVNRRPDHLLIEWSDAKMIVPGRIKVRDLKIRGHHRRMDWYMELEQAELSVDLWALMDKTFRTESVRGEGLRFLIRQRLHDGVDDSHAEHYPEIPGTPIEHVAPRPIGPRRSPGWTIDLGGLNVRRTEEVWFNEYRLLGVGDVAGRMSFRIRGPMSVGAELSWTEGRVALAGNESVSGLEFDTKVDIDPMVPRDAKGIKFLEYLEAQLKLEGDFAQIGFLNYYMKNAGNLDLKSRGHLSCDLNLNRGRFQPGSTLLLDAPALAASVTNLNIEGRGRLEGSVSEMRLKLRDIEVHGVSESPLTARTGVDLIIRTTDSELTDEQRDPEVILELPDLQLPDLRAFNAVIPEGLGLSIIEGEAEVVASLDLTRSDGDGALQVRGEGIVVELNERRLGGDLEVDVLYAGGLTPSQLSLDGTRLAFGPPGTDGKWAEFIFKEADLLMESETSGHGFTPADGQMVIEGRIADLAVLNEFLSYGKWLGLHGEVDLDTIINLDGRSVTSGSQVELQSDHLLARFMGWEVGGRAKIVGNVPEHNSEQGGAMHLAFEEVEIGRDGKGHFRGPDLQLRTWGTDVIGGSGLEGLNVRLDLEQAEVLDVSLLNEYLPHTELIALHSGALQLEGFTELSEEAGEARIELTAEDLVAHLHGEPFTTQMLLELDMGSSNPGAQRFSVDGSRLRLEETRWGEAESGGEAPRHWEGQFEILDGEIALGKPPTIDASVELTLQDTRPLMHGLFSKSSAAEWFESWLVIHDVDGTADVHLGADGMRLDDLKLSSDLVTLDGSVHLIPPKNGAPRRIENFRARGELIKPLMIEFEELNHLLHSHTISFARGVGELLGHIEVAGDAAAGQVILTGKELGMMIWDEELRTDLSLDIEMRSEDLHSHRFDLSGTSVRLDNGHWLGDEYADKHPGWWAELKLAEGEVVLGSPLTIDTMIELHVRDTHPLVHLLAMKSKPAHWFHRFLEIQEVDGTARLHMGPDGIRLDDVLIEGKGMKIEGRLALSEGHEYALFHIVLHHLSASMEIRDGEHELKLIQAKNWYEKRLEATTAPQGPARSAQ